MCAYRRAGAWGAEGDGFRFAMAGLDGGRLNIAACSLGGMQEATNKALAYVKERRQFGHAIADFQATQFGCRYGDRDAGGAHDAVFRREGAGCEVADGDALVRDGEAGSLRTRASRSPTTPLQLHGGYGYLSDYGVERIVRDLRVHQILEGTNEVMR